MRRWILQAVISGLLCSIAVADVYYEEEITTSGFGGRGATRLTRKVSIKGDRQKRLTAMEVDKTMAEAMRKAGRSLVTSDIIRLDRTLVWDLDHDEQTFTEQKFVRSAAQAVKLQAAKRISMPAAEDTSTCAPPEISVDLKRTGSSKKILGFPCEQVVLTMTTVRMDARTKTSRETRIVYDAWLTRAFPGYNEIRTFTKSQSEITGTPTFDLPGMDAMKSSMADVMEKLKQRAGELEGFTLLSTIGIYSGGGNTPIFTITREVARAEQRTIPASEFEVPGSFSKVKAE